MPSPRPPTPSSSSCSPSPIALNPEKLTQRLGKILSPTLLTLIAVLFIAAIVHPLGEYGAVRAPYDAAPFVRGFIEGYQTMDTLAALNFGLIIAMNIRALGVTKDSGVVRETIFAGFVAGFCSSRSMPRLRTSAPKRAVRALRAKTAPRPSRAS